MAGRRRNVASDHPNAVRNGTETPTGHACRADDAGTGIEAEGPTCGNDHHDDLRKATRARYCRINAVPTTCSLAAFVLLVAALGQTSP